jgi:hypothetical protein
MIKNMQQNNCCIISLKAAKTIKRQRLGLENIAT